MKSNGEAIYPENLPEVAGLTELHAFMAIHYPNKHFSLEAPDANAVQLVYVINAAGQSMGAPVCWIKAKHFPLLKFVRQQQGLQHPFPKPTDVNTYTDLGLAVLGHNKLLRIEAYYRAEYPQVFRVLDEAEYAIKDKEELKSTMNIHDSYVIIMGKQEQLRKRIKYCKEVLAE